MTRMETNQKTLKEIPVYKIRVIGDKTIMTSGHVEERKSRLM